MCNISTTRIFVVGSLIALASFLLNFVRAGSIVKSGLIASRIPLVIGEWHGSEQPVDLTMIQAAGVDRYVNRHYRSADGHEVQLYIGYNADQRRREVIHSPANCLPAAGWQPVYHRSLDNLGPGMPSQVEEYVIQKDLRRDLVLYWFHGRGRDVGSEYLAKFWFIYDSILKNRADGSLVRLVTPAEAGEASALGPTLRFLKVFFPHLAESDANS